MQSQWQKFLELTWPSRYDPVARRAYRIALLEVFLAVGIALAAGPEIFTAMEMTAFMELLGGVLFLTAMGAGARLVGSSFWSAFCRLLLPPPIAAIMRPSTSIPVRTVAYVYLAAVAVWNLALLLNCRQMPSLDCAVSRA